MPNAEILVQLGSAGAVIYVVILFLKEIKEIRLERKIEREEWLDIIRKDQQLMDTIVNKCQGREFFLDTIKHHVEDK